MNSQEVLGNGISLSVFFQSVLLCVFWTNLLGSIHVIIFHSSKLSYLFLSISKAPSTSNIASLQDAQSLQD